MICLAPPELVVDFALPASLASRYRARLVAVSRLEVQVRFFFQPSLFRKQLLESYPVELSLVLSNRGLRLPGVLSVDPRAGSAAARIRFDEPVALPDYALLRRASGLEEKESEPAPVQLEADPSASLAVATGAEG